MTHTAVSLSETRKSLFMPGTITADDNGEFVIGREIAAAITTANCSWWRTCSSKLYEQSNDAYAAIESGALSTPYPITPILGACLDNSGFSWRRLLESISLLMSQTFRPWTIDQPLLLRPLVDFSARTIWLASFWRFARASRPW